MTFSPEDQGALRVTLEDLGDNFGIVIIEAPKNFRGEVIRSVQEMGAVTFVPVDADGCASVVSLLHLAMGEETGGAILYGLESLAADPELDALAGLNMRRDVLSRVIRGPLVLVADSETLRIISERLPDFYSWRVFSTSVSSLHK